jgi:hypothetical protein
MLVKSIIELDYEITQVVRGFGALKQVARVQI